MTNISKRFATLGAALLALTASCSDTTLEPTFGEGCLRGSLSAGETVQGSFTPAGCQITYHWYSGNNTVYESWSVHLEAGKAYMFYMEQAPDPEQDGANDVDAVLALWGKDAQGHSFPLAVSDDEGGGIDGHNSEFWFIAPKSGDFILVASTYDWEDLGGYRLSMQACPILGTMDTSGTYIFPSRSSPCIRHYNSDYGYPMAYNFIRVDADAFESIDVWMEHESAYPYYEMFGPGMDTYANIYDETESDYDYGGSSVDISTDEIGGIVTIAVGTDYFDAPGNYTVYLDRNALPSAPQMPWHDGKFSLRSTFPKIEAKKAATP